MRKTNKAKAPAATQTWFVQVRQAQFWEDLYIDAEDEAAAVAGARAETTLDARWATFVL